MKGTPLILTSVLLGAAAQVILKLGMETYGEVSIIGIWGQLPDIFRVPQVLVGFLLYGLSSVLWIAVVSTVDLSKAYPMVSVAYVTVVLASWLFLGESLSALRLTGLVFIVAGVTVMSRS